jgi:hypothetical protein
MTIPGLEHFGDQFGENPTADFETIRADLFTRLRKQSVSEHSLEGVKIAMQIAFRLGERKGIKDTLGAIAEETAR